MTAIHLIATGVDPLAEGCWFQSMCQLGDLAILTVAAGVCFPKNSFNKSVCDCTGEELSRIGERETKPVLRWTLAGQDDFRLRTELNSV